MITSPSAHVKKSSDGPETIREPLLHPEDGHLDQVARLATMFGKEMMANETLGKWVAPMCTLLGMWHDVGKYSKEFQEYIHGSENDAHSLEMKGRVDHSTAGAQLAVQKIPVWGTLLAFAMAGHHAGLADWSGTERSCLQQRLAKKIPAWQEYAPSSLLTPVCQIEGRSPLPGNGFTVAFLVRMLFSCLCDADFLATEQFMDPARSDQRMTGFPAMQELARHLRLVLEERFATAQGEVAEKRRAVLAACRERATLPPGFFSLTVPTGGGKTLSALSFALEHAACHGLQRVICAIPFTSIIEQNARVYRDVFDSLHEGIILEHHANLDPDDPKVMAGRLATENWQVPIVVTTNVQLLESLFADRPGRCRKLHHIARSVIVLDEAQALQVSLLKPTLCALEELVNNYGCSVVLSTATQPAIHHRDNFPIGLTGNREIIPDPASLHAGLRRVEVHQAGVLTLEETARQVAALERVLVIVNTRHHAKALFDQLTWNAEEHFHLSALMCPEHRSAVIARIKERLRMPGAPCRVISTQLVEAGVDIDFPVVYRALAGLDAIAQAAGRCNREGLLPSPGRTEIFLPAEEKYSPPPGELRQAAQHAAEVLALAKYKEDPLSLKAMEHYFELHLWSRGGDGGNGWDEKKIMDCFELGKSQNILFPFNFATAARNYRLIEDQQLPIIIPWDEHARQVIHRLQNLLVADASLLRHAARQLQRYLVTVSRWDYERLNNTLALTTLHERFTILLNPEKHYSPVTGLLIPTESNPDPADLIVT